MRLNQVLLHPTAVRVHQPETELGSSMALFGCPLIPSGCLCEVLWRPDADIVGEPEFVLGLWIAALGFHAQCIDTVLRIACSGPSEFDHFHSPRRRSRESGLQSVGSDQHNNGNAVAIYCGSPSTT